MQSINLKLFNKEIAIALKILRSFQSKCLKKQSYDKITLGDKVKL